MRAEMMSTEHAHGEELRAVRARVVADEGALRELQRVARLAPPAELALSWEAGDAVGVVAALHAATNRDCAAARSAAASFAALFAPPPRLPLGRWLTVRGAFDAVELGIIC